MIEILQTEESTHSTMQQIQDYPEEASSSHKLCSHMTAEARNPRLLLTSRIPVLQISYRLQEDNAFDVVNPSARQHMKECRAQNVTCNGCGIKGHLKKCCKKSGNFPKDSNRQNQSSSTGSGKMNFASAASLPQTECRFLR